MSPILPTVAGNGSPVMGSHDWGRLGLFNGEILATKTERSELKNRWSWIWEDRAKKGKNESSLFAQTFSGDANVLTTVNYLWRHGGNFWHHLFRVLAATPSLSLVSPLLVMYATKVQPIGFATRWTGRCKIKLSHGSWLKNINADAISSDIHYCGCMHCFATCINWLIIIMTSILFLYYKYIIVEKSKMKYTPTFFRPPTYINPLSLSTRFIRIK